MNKEHIYSILSLLFQYPKEQTKESLKQLVQENSEQNENLYAIAREFLSSDTSSNQQLYTEIFDMSKSTNLSIAWHRYGDTPHYGRALASLQELYKDAGFEIDGRTLPDFFPLMLEVIGKSDDWVRDVLVDGFGKQLDTISSSISQQYKDSMYNKAFCETLKSLNLDS